MENPNPDQLQPSSTQNTEWENYTRQLNIYLQNPENTSKISTMLLRGDQFRFTIDLDDLRSQCGNELCQALIRNPARSLQLLHTQLHAIIDDMGNTGAQPKKKQYGEDATVKKQSYHIQFVGSLGRNLVTPRGIGANLINQLVGVQGIVTRVSIFRPKRVTSVHYCDATQQGSVRHYPDEFNLEEPQTTLGTAYPLKDPQGNPLTTEYGYCIQRDFQTLVLQEMPEKAPPGMLPRSVDVVLEDDLVEKVKPGDRVEVIGVYKCVSKSNAVGNAIFRTVLVATNIRIIGNEVKEMELSANDIENIKKISKRKDLLEILSESLAPAIQGHL